MKTTIAFLLCGTALHASEPSRAFQDLKERRSMESVRFERGPGACSVTGDRLPDYVTEALRAKMKDPDSMEIIGWTHPVIRTVNAKGQLLAWWHVDVKVRARNSYGGYVVENYALMIEHERVTRAILAP